MKKNKEAEIKAYRSSEHKSWILFWLDRLSEIIYKAFGSGLFGFIFTSYTKEQDSFENGFIKNHFTESSKIRQLFRKIKKYLSRSFENSSLLKGAEKSCKLLTSFPLKAYGSLFFSFGLYVTLTYLIRLFLPIIETADASVAIIGVSVCIISVPMLLSSNTVAESVGRSKIVGTFFKEMFGFRDEAFEAKRKKSKSSIMIIIGMLLGVLTLWVHPLAILASIALLILLAIVIASPEVGIVISLFSLPFLSLFEAPATILGLLVLTISISYIVKLIRGKRILKIEILDITVILFSILVFASGAISAGGKDGFKECLLTAELVLGYFLVVNLMRSTEWIKRCITALVFSGTIVSFIGIAQYCLGIFVEASWIDKSYFYDIKGRVVSLFDNPNILAMYLIMVLPFAIYLMINACTGKSKLLGFISTASIFLCTILTWSRAAWLAMIVCILVFAVIYSKQTIKYLLISMFLLPIISFFIPSSVARRFASIGNLADSSTAYRFYTWKGTLRCCRDSLWGGVGYGTNAYREIYPQYAYAGMEAAEHSHSLYLQILIGMGIFGLIVFAIVMFLFLQMNFEYIKKESNKERKTAVIACIGAIISMLVFGLFDFIWYNYRVLFLFCAIIALSCACVRIGYDESRRHSYRTDMELN